MIYTPHTHPRSAELNNVVQGTLKGSVTAENGAPHMQHTLNQYQMTVFPQGAMHTEWNPDCVPAVFVASFSNEDPGVQQSLQTLVGFEDDVIRAAMSGDRVSMGRIWMRFGSTYRRMWRWGWRAACRSVRLG